VVGRANGLSERQRIHVIERDMLQRLYTGLFLDAPLPLFGDLEVTCRELSNAWWVLGDLAWQMMEEVKDRRLSSPEALAAAALTVKVSDLSETLAMALGIQQTRSRSIVEIFICDPSQPSTLFPNSLWTTPLLPAAGDRCHIVLAPLLAGEPIRRIEAWLERGGISDQRRLGGRGKPFEAHVRDVIGKRLAENSLITDYVVLPTELKRVDGSEEVDFLARIGNTLIVGEVKCFLAPVEPMDRFNYLNAIDDAAEQTQRKCNWIDTNRIDVLPKLGVADSERLAAIHLVPVVILNRGYGFGLDLDGVAVTDLHFLSLLLGEGEYAGDTRVERGSIMGAPVKLYDSQAALERGLHSLLTRPRPLQRYRGTISWTTEPFPTSTGRPFVIELPRLTGEPFNMPELRYRGPGWEGMRL
jgi:hypothetical protein